MNGFLSPLNWGVFFALVIIMGALALLPPFAAVAPHYLRSISAHDAIAWPMFYCGLALVAMLSARYFFAILFNLYGGSHLTGNLDSRIKKFIFCFLSLLQCLSVLSINAVALFGVKIAMIATLLMSLVSIACVLVCWVVGLMSKEGSSTPLLFGGYDAFFGGISVFYLLALWSGPDYKSVVGLYVLAPLGALLVAHELAVRHGSTFQAMVRDVEGFLRS